MKILRESLFSEYQINHPATTNMFPRLPAMSENLSAAAARFFQRIRQDGQPVKGTFLIDGVGQFGHRTFIPYCQSRVEIYG